MTKNMIGRWQLIGLMAIVVGTGLAIKGYSVKAINANEAAAGQDVINLNQRLSSLEQRVIMMESSVRRIEQQQMSMPRTSSPVQPTRDPEVERLRSQVETLTLRIRELECGIVHLDERTLTTSMKEARRRLEGEARDPCRLAAEAPVKLSMRQ